VKLRIALTRAMAIIVVPSPSWWHQKEPLTVPLAYGSQTSFKNVHEVRPACFQARVSVKNKGRCTVWTSETAEETVWVLARWRLDPCGLSSPGKKRAHAAQMGGALASACPPLFFC